MKRLYGLALLSLSFVSLCMLSTPAFSAYDLGQLRDRDPGSQPSIQDDYLVITSIVQDQDSGEISIHGQYGEINGGQAVALTTSVRDVNGKVVAIAVFETIYQYANGEFEAHLGVLPPGNYDLTFSYGDGSDSAVFTITQGGVLQTP